MNMKMATDFCLMFEFNKIDADGNGTIDIDEFVSALLPNATWQIFTDYDREHTGKVDVEKLPEMLSHLSMKKGHSKHPQFESVLETAMTDFGVANASDVTYSDFHRIAARIGANASESLLSK